MGRYSISRIGIDEIIIYLILTSVSEAEEAGQPTQPRLPLHEDDHLRRQGSLQRLQLPTTSLLDQHLRPNAARGAAGSD